MTDSEAARYAYLAEGNAKQARKRVAADVLLQDAAGRVPLVNPTYKDYWDLPGGMAESNEPPRIAAERELREELGLTITVGRVLVVDWDGPHASRSSTVRAISTPGNVTAIDITILLAKIAGPRYVSISGPEDPVEPRYVSISGQRVLFWLRVRRSAGMPSAARTGIVARAGIPALKKDEFTVRARSTALSPAVISTLRLQVIVAVVPGCGGTSRKSGVLNIPLEKLRGTYTTR